MPDKTDTIVVEEVAVRLALLKTQERRLKEEIKEAQQELLDAGVACNLQTKYGKLAYTVRENYATSDQAGLIKFMGQKAFNAHATISKTGVEKAIGDVGFRDALDKGLMQVKNVSEYFMLKK
jgi:hypothetical protein